MRTITRVWSGSSCNFLYGCRQNIDVSVAVILIPAAVLYNSRCGGDESTSSDDKVHHPRGEGFRTSHGADMPR